MSSPKRKSEGVERHSLARLVRRKTSRLQIPLLYVELPVGIGWKIIKSPKRDVNRAISAGSDNNKPPSRWNRNVNKTSANGEADFHVADSVVRDGKRKRFCRLIVHGAFTPNDPSSSLVFRPERLECVPVAVGLAGRCQHLLSAV